MKAPDAALLACVGSLLALGAGSRMPQAKPVVIRARAMVDVEASWLIENAAVLVRDGVIVAAGPSGTVAVPAGATIIDLPDTTLLPGLIDAHVHLTLTGSLEANARATLLAGFTTVQDLGAIAYGNIAVRDAITSGRVEGPRVIASGPWLGVTGGTCDLNGIGVRGADAFRARVRQDVERGADLIKVCVSGWLADAVANPRGYEITDSELAAAIDEAHRLKRRVAVHALSEEAIDVSVRLGADLIVHAGFASATAVAEMKKRAVYQLSTLLSLAGNKPEHVSALRAHMRATVSGGLPLAFGTDAGVIPHGANAREFAELSVIGLDPAASIKAATLHSARAVGLAGQIGLLKAGYVADVIGVNGNPLKDLGAIEKVTFVMLGGRVVKRKSAVAPPV